VSGGAVTVHGGVSAFHFNVSPSEYVPPRCKIDWNKGKNVTVKTVKKKQKHKGRGQTRTIVKTVQQESFFNTFSLPEGKSVPYHPDV